MNDGNGWDTYKRLILTQLTRIEGQVEALREDVQDLMMERKALHLRVAFIAVAVSAAVALGGRAVYELLIRVLL